MFYLTNITLKSFVKGLAFSNLRSYDSNRKLVVSKNYLKQIHLEEFIHGLLEC